jgi:hypothetical protein
LAAGFTLRLLRERSGSPYAEGHIFGVGGGDSDFYGGGTNSRHFNSNSSQSRWKRDHAIFPDRTDHPNHYTRNGFAEPGRSYQRDPRQSGGSNQFNTAADHSWRRGSTDGLHRSGAYGRDLAIGAADSAWAISTNTTGVAEAARLARAARATHKPRVFTNADIARLRGNAPVSVVGNTAPPVTNEQTMPASDVQEQEQNGATTPATPSPKTQAPPANQNPSTPKSPFRAKPSPNQPR